ncbi:MAG: hypothetical protein GX322_05730 [Firmicutes bacterium]|nr:hypothetical protein [Bacillota bacterium]
MDINLNMLGERTVILLEGQLCSTRCMVCGSQCVTGISILGSRICSACETALVETRAEGPGYDKYVIGLRAIWQGVPLRRDQDGIRCELSLDLAPGEVGVWADPPTD